MPVPEHAHSHEVVRFSAAGMVYKEWFVPLERKLI